MASITATATAPAVVRATLSNKGVAGISSSPVLGLPKIKMGARVKCSVEKKANTVPVAPASTGAASLLAAMTVIGASNPAWALVDERMSTEGTGLSLGLSNNLLGWILLGVFGLIWSFYIVYTSSLEEDEESGLSL